MHDEQRETIESDRLYFARRCLEELCAADAAACREASSLHYELAGRYAALAGLGPIAPHRTWDWGAAKQAAHRAARAANSRGMDQADYVSAARLHSL